MNADWLAPSFGLVMPGSSDNRARTRFFGLGEVRLALLSMLAEAPNHGYQLMKALSERLGELYRSSAGTVYPALKQLQKEGLIDFRLKKGRYIYHLTKEGQKVVRSQAESIGEIWSRASGFHGLGQQLGAPAVVIASPLQEVVAAGLKAARWSSGNPDREDRVRAILRDTALHLRCLIAEQSERQEETL